MNSQYNAWADIGPTNNKSQEQMLREILEQSHTAKKHAEWAYQFAREGNLKRAQEHLEQTKTACEQYRVMNNGIEHYPAHFKTAIARIVQAYEENQQDD